MTKDATRGRPVWRIALAVALTLVLVGGGNEPAAALFDPNKAYGEGVFRGCTSQGESGTVDAQAFLREYGDSKVSKFGARFKLYTTETTAGWNFPQREKSYASSEFPSDALSYSIWLPNGVNHRWSGITAGIPRRLDVKLTWARKWRRDFTYTVTVAHFDTATCSPG
jgi:hypothetical protein